MTEPRPDSAPAAAAAAHRRGTPPRLRQLMLGMATAAALAGLGGLGGCAHLGERMTEAVLAAEREDAHLVAHRATLPSGETLAWLEGGQGEPLVLLHGFGGNKDNFVRVARLLSPHYRVIIPDHLGFGDSDHPAGADYGARAQAARLHALLEHLGTGPVHLGGNSMGGLIAMRYAIAWPAGVQSLWLLDPAGLPEGPHSEVRETIERTGVNPLLIDDEAGFDRMLALVMADPPWIPGPARAVMARERIANRALEARVFPQIALDSVQTELRGLRVPSLIVWGERDRVIHPGTAALLHGLLPDSDVRLMPGLGHVPMIEAPQRTAEDYLAFRRALAARLQQQRPILAP